MEKAALMLMQPYSSLDIYVTQYRSYSLTLSCVIYCYVLQRTRRAFRPRLFSVWLIHSLARFSLPQLVRNAYPTQSSAQSQAIYPTTEASFAINLMMS